MSDIFQGKQNLDNTYNYEDYKYTDYRLFGLAKQEIFDTNGDIKELNFYRNYDDVNDLFTQIAVKEFRTYTRSTATGLPTKRVTDITWYDENGNVILTKSNVTKYYSSDKGFKANKRARQNLIDKASMYLFGALMQIDATTAEANVENFEALSNNASNSYIKSNMQPLIDIITNSTDNTKNEFRSYMTVGIRDTLLTILNVTYKA